MTACAIVGSRHWMDYLEFFDCLPDLHGVTRIVSGGARGVDAMAERYALSLDLEFVAYAVDDRKRGAEWTAAAHARNQQIVDAVDMLIAMPGPSSRGTWDTIRRGWARGIQVKIIHAPV